MRLLRAAGVPYVQTTDLSVVAPELDILDMTRVQQERFFNEEDYLRLRDRYILTPEKLKTAKPDMCILHPLPRVNEISVAVDEDPRACYFEQVENGKYMRMALILMLVGVKGMTVDSIRNGIVMTTSRRGAAWSCTACWGWGSWTARSHCSKT